MVGNALLHQERGYDVRGGGWIEMLMHDVRYGVRTLRANPAFTIVATLTLALGIGANTAIFSVASGVLMRPLPYRAADELSMIWMDNARIQLREDWHSYPGFDEYRRLSSTFADMAIFNGRSTTLTDGSGGDPERVIGAHGSANLFTLLGVPPARGRGFAWEEDRPGANNVVVISHALWQRRFGGRTDILDSTVLMNTRPMRIIGVMPEGFAFPSVTTEFWVPTAPTDQQRTNGGSLWLQVIGRRKPGVSVAQAQSDLGRLADERVRRDPGQKGYGVYVVDYREQIVGRVRPAILVLLGAVGFVLLIACTNVANLLMARASARERELALRSAIGADRARLIRQLLTESLLLSAIGGVAGMSLAWLGLRALIRLAPADLPRLSAIAIDTPVLVFTALVVIATGVLFGLLPAVQAARSSVVPTLKEGGRGATAAGRGLRRALVTLEVALAVVLLVGAGLMIRSFVKLQQVDLGFAPDQVLSARVALYGERYREAPAVVDFFGQLMDKLNAAPGVEGAAGVGTVFLSATPNSTNFSIEGRPDFAPEDAVEVPVDAVTPTYFKVMRVPLRRGRFFDARDSAEAPRTVIINETMARRFWPNEDPIGRRIAYGSSNPNARWMEIVGVVADTRRTGYESVVRPETYLPHAQSPSGGMMLVIRSAGDAQSAAPALRAAVRDLDTTVALQGVRPITDLLVDMTAQRRLNTVLLAVFGVVAGLLAAVGIYGVLAYSVEARTREMGVRVALGASRASILALVLREGLMLAGIGLVLGLAGALALTRTMRTLVYQVSTVDPATFAVIAAVAATVSLAACLIPAWRAVRVDPILALRAD